MLSTFLDHQWKAFWRSKNKGGSIAAQIFMGFIIVYFLVLAIAVGFGFEKLSAKLFPDHDPFTVFNAAILYYFAIDFLMRMQLQELPTLAIVPYLHLNIPKRKIVNFLNVTALFSAFNIIPLLLFLPFCLTGIFTLYGGFPTLMYVVSIVSLIILNNYGALYLKRLSLSNLKLIPILMLIIAGLGLLEYYKIFSIAAVANEVFNFIADHPWAALGFTVLTVVVFIINAHYLRNNLYVEELSKNEKEKTSTDYPFLDRFGAVGTLLALELKLMLRHKRTRSAFTTAVLFLFYGFLFYKKEFLDKDSLGMMLFAAVFMTGSTISIYGQFMFGWQASHFDGLMANKVDLRNFIKAKFLLFTIASSITTLIVCLYGFISWKILVVQFAAYFYNLGIGTVIVLLFATRNYRAIDLSKGQAFNFQGVGASQWVLGLPYFLAPYAIYLPFSFFGHQYWGMITLGGFGILGLLTREYWIKLIIKMLNKQKYKIAEGFRENS